MSKGFSTIGRFRVLICSTQKFFTLKRFIVHAAVRVGGARRPTKLHRRYAAQVLRTVPSAAAPARRVEWAPTFEELFIVDPHAFTSEPIPSTSARTLDDHPWNTYTRVQRVRRPHDPDGLPLSTDPMVLDGDSLTSTPEPILSLPILRTRTGKKRARDAEWLRDVWSTSEYARLALRTRPSFEQIAEGMPYYDDIMGYKLQ